MSQPRGEVFDLGYRHYQGPREGRMRARKALWVNGVRTALGLGRGWPSKILPIFLFVAVMIPAFVGIIIASQVQAGDDFVSHADYYQIVSVILLLFSAIIAPELLCTDRREGVIQLYLVRPLTTTDYLAGRWLAFLSVTLALVYVGQVLLFAGFILAADSPLDYIRDNWLDVPRFLLAGLAVAVFTTTIPMAVSAFTTRRAYAAAFVIGLFIISIPVSDILGGCTEHQDGRRTEAAQDCDRVTGDAAPWFALISIPQVPMHLNELIFNEDDDSSFVIRELPDIVPVAWFLLLTIGPGFVLWWRYQRLRI